MREPLWGLTALLLVAGCESEDQTPATSAAGDSTGGSTGGAEDTGSVFDNLPPEKVAFFVAFHTYGMTEEFKLRDFLQPDGSYYPEVVDISGPCDSGDYSVTGTYEPGDALVLVDLTWDLQSCRTSTQTPSGPLTMTVTGQIHEFGNVVFESDGAFKMSSITQESDSVALQSDELADYADALESCPLAANWTKVSDSLPNVGGEACGAAVDPN